MTIVESVSASLTEKELAAILDSIDCRLMLDGVDYLLLIKRQSSNSCRLTLTDCSSNFYSKMLDVKALQNLKTELHLLSDTRTFATHFAESLKTKGKLELNKERQEIRLIVEIGIEQGLVMSCSLNIKNRINFELHPNQFKKTLHLFFIQLYEAKQSQTDLERKKCDQSYKNLSSAPGAQEGKNESTTSKKGEGKRIRNLMNPEKKKRKSQGARIGNDL